MFKVKCFSIIPSHTYYYLSSWANAIAICYFNYSTHICNQIECDVWLFVYNCLIIPENLSQYLENLSHICYFNYSTHICIQIKCEVWLFVYNCLIFLENLSQYRRHSYMINRIFSRLNYIWFHHPECLLIPRLSLRCALRPFPQTVWLGEQQSQTQMSSS